MFENMEIYPYRRAGKGGKKQLSSPRVYATKRLPMLWEGIGQALSIEGLAVCCAGFFLGRAVLMGELTPFGASFVVASARALGRPALLAVPATILGLATVSRGLPLTGSALAVFLAWFLASVLPVDLKRPWLVLPALVLAVVVIIKTPVVALTGPSPYKYYTVLFEALFAALLTPVMTYGLEALKKKAGAACRFTGEEIFCILMILGGIIAGTGDLRYEMISAKGVLSRLTILLSALVGGAGAGAAAGAVVGIIPGLAYTVTPAMVGAYSFAGLLAGACRNFGKIGVATGFLLGNIILSVYVTDYGNIIAALAETAIAVLLFILFPAFLIENLRISLSLETERAVEPAEEGKFLKETFERRVKNWAKVFIELSCTFEQVSSSAVLGREEQTLQKLFAQVSKKVCTGCAFFRTCWEREFYKTYQNLIDLLAQVEIYGRISPDNLSGEIKRRCSRTKELAITLNCLYETYNVNRYWSRRLLDSREIVAEQLKGIAEIIAGLPGELEFEEEASEIGPVLRKKLRESGIKPESLSVYRCDDGGVEVSLTHIPCGGRKDCRDIIAPALMPLGQPVYPAITSCTVREGEQACCLRFYPDLNYRLSLGAAGAGKSGSLVCGDSYGYFYLKGGRFGLALSDGMGAGPRAALESSATISLLRRLLESGFGQDLAIKTVNSVLVLRSPEESFATVDLVVVNLYNGQADFVKIGAVPSFIVRKGQVGQVKASSLPAGIIEDIEVVSLARALEAGDILVMVTDGILDSYQGAGDREEWLTEVLLDVADMPPQEMAEIILKLAQTGAKGATRVPDDMTVLVAKLETQEKLKH